MERASCDLHTHSYYSDGTDSPQEIVDKALELGLAAVALTDHNTTKNCAALKKAAENYGLVCLYGMELTTMEEVHTLCLFADKNASDKWNDFVYEHLPSEGKPKDIPTSEGIVEAWEIDGVTIFYMPLRGNMSKEDILLWRKVLTEIFK
jgi:PHP family Zn ribbon phosphoesterase